MAVDESRVSTPPSLVSARVGDAAFVVLLVSTALGIVAFDRLGPDGRVAVALVAFGAFGLLFTPALRPHALTRRRVIPAIVVLTLVAVLTPARGSHDIWSYAAYGRLISIHHVSPFTHVPADFPHDALGYLVAHGWRHTGSVYGPGFAGLSAIGTAVTGSSVLATRLFFQGMEAAALVAVLMILWRRTRDPIALAFIGLNPAVVAVVNGGHNDLLVGLALLGGTLLLLDDRPRRAGGLLALGALVKLVMVLPVGALLVWAWRRRGGRSALETGATFSLVVGAGYLAAGGTQALGPLLNAAKHRSRGSIWELLQHWVLDPLGAHGPKVSSLIGTAAVIMVGLVAVVVIAAAVFPSFRSRAGSMTAHARIPALSSAAAVVGATALVFLLGASYTLPWYSAWALPVVAVAWHQRVAAVAALQAAVLSIVYMTPLSRGEGLLGNALDVWAQTVVPALCVAGLVYLAWSARSGRLTDPVVPATSEPRQRPRTRRGDGQMSTPYSGPAPSVP